MQADNYVSISEHRPVLYGGGVKLSWLSVLYVYGVYVLVSKKAYYVGGRLKLKHYTHN